MSPLRIALADDEPLARERLTRMLQEAGCEVLAQLKDGVELVEWLSQGSSLDALFIDIRMPGLTGFEALDEIRHPPPVVFVTAYVEHAFEAFEHEAVDYLLKPITAKRVARTLDRLKRHLIPRRTGAELQALLAPGARYPVKAGGGHLFVELRKTTHFELLDDVVHAHVGAQSMRTQWTSLTEVEEAFPRARLFRIQRNVLVRPEAIVGLRNTLSGCGMARLNDGRELEVSRRSKQALKEALGL
jgi:DNA-binding LytR/AlgR family response regulator